MMLKSTSHRTYLYRGDDDERIPQDVHNVEYIANITKIKAGSAEECPYLTSVTHPDSIIAIEDEAYKWCGFMTNLRLSSSLQTIGISSFDGCESITMLELPSTLHTIMKSGFKYCRSVRSISPQQQNEPLSLKTIGEEAFRGCSSLASIPHIPSIVTIGPGAFAYCSTLTEVTLGSSVTSAARDSFIHCSSLAILRCTYHTFDILPWAVTHVTVERGTTHIHTSAFAGCDRLHSIFLTSAVISIGPSAFWGCTLLPADFILLKTTQEVGIGAFARCGIKSSTLPLHATLDIYKFVGGKGEMAPYEVLRVEIGEGVHEIRKGVFRGCEQMLFLNILSKSITIQTGAFFNCNLLQEIHFHEGGNMNIESGAFDNCENLSVVKWPNVVQWIFDGKFGELTSPKDRPLIPAMHKDAFNVFSTAIAEDCERYSYLFLCWNWIVIREMQRHKRQKIERTRSKSDEQNPQLNCLCDEEMYMLTKACKLVPPPPKDLIDAIVNDLHSYDSVLSKIPKDIVWKVIEYIP